VLNFFYPLIRWILFRLDPEKTHDLTLKWLKRFERSPVRFLMAQACESDPVELWGIKFPNRVGLAAGLDKNGACIDAFAALGFGHIEVGTVTPRPQTGNPKPRLFRLPKAKALINRFGFNNQGVDQLIENIKNTKYTGVLGINIGKNFDTPAEKTINISSPNTSGLRDLQFGQALDDLLSAIKAKQADLANQYTRRIPVLIKIAPDLTEQDVGELAEAFVKHQVDGVIATNTTFSREGVEKLKFGGEQGGLSGAPVLSSSTEVLERLVKKTNNAFPVIGVGGILCGDDAQKKLAAGASLVQVYSGLIYRGPRLIVEIAKALKNSLKP